MLQIELFKNNIEELLHLDVELGGSINDHEVPILVSQEARLHNAKIASFDFIVAIIEGDVSLKFIRYCNKLILGSLNKQCIFFVDNISAYCRGKLIEEGIPFVQTDKQFYIPFLGTYIKNYNYNKNNNFDSMSSMAQKVLLSYIYNRWDNANITKVSAELGISKMSASRSFDELDFMDIGIVQHKGSRRYLAYSNSMRDFCDDVLPKLKSPLIREYYVKNKVEFKALESGISGLSSLTMLADNPYKTFAMSKEDIRKNKIRELEMVPKYESPYCVIQELSYIIPFKGHNTIDPVSIYLLTGDKLSDERISIMREQILEDYVW